MALSTVKFLAVAAGLAVAGSAHAVTVVPDAGNLQAFSYSVSGRTIIINETWGPKTGTFVDLAITGLQLGRRSYTVIKRVTNLTGVDFRFFELELLNSDKSGSDNLDGLSFAQNGTPFVNRTSDVFADVFVDELEDRDFLRFSNGVLGNGQTGSFRFGLTLTRTDNNEPFYLRQSGTLPIVPEPATWALLIAGFGLVGFAMRRRKSAIATVSA